MATQRDVRRIALSLPETTEDPNRFRFAVRGKHFAWVWNERIDPKRARVPNPEVVAVRVADDIDKQLLIASDRSAFFTEPHYDGYPAVLIRLPAIGLERLREVLVQAWRCQAPRSLAERRPRLSDGSESTRSPRG